MRMGRARPTDTRREARTARLIASAIWARSSSVPAWIGQRTASRPCAPAAKAASISSRVASAASPFERVPATGGPDAAESPKRSACALAAAARAVDVSSPGMSTIQASERPGACPLVHSSFVWLLGAQPGSLAGSAPFAMATSPARQPSAITRIPGSEAIRGHGTAPGPRRRATACPGFWATCRRRRGGRKVNWEEALRGVLKKENDPDTGLAASLWHIGDVRNCWEGSS